MPPTPTDVAATAEEAALVLTAAVLAREGDRAWADGRALQGQVLHEACRLISERFTHETTA